jgi:alpha-D-glucose phosphate-specific phosphoglucomutase
LAIKLENIAFGTDGWRAVMAREFTFENVALVAQAIADHVLASGKSGRGVVVGGDARFLSEQFSQLVSDVMTANGIPVYMPDRDTPTPVVAYTVKDKGAAGAVMLTASHNPPEYNGIKFIPDYCHPALPDVTDAIVANVQRLQKDPGGVKSDANSSLVQVIDPRPAYFAHVRQLIDFKSIADAKLKVWVDPMYATGRGYLSELLREAGATVDVIHNERNPLFGGSLPDPNEKNLAELSARVVEGRAHVGLSMDNDADRFGVVDATGKYVNANQVICLVFLHWLRTRHPKGSVVRTAPTTHQVDALAEHFGFSVQETPVGFKWVGNALNTTDAIMGGEESGGLSVKGHIPEKDGIVADLVIAEQIAKTGKTPLETLAEIDALVGRFETTRVDAHISNERKNALMNSLKSDPPPSFAGLRVVKTGALDGVQLVLEDGSWILARPSGTEPIIRVYIEGRTTQQIDTLKKAVDEMVGH